MSDYIRGSRAEAAQEFHRARRRASLEGILARISGRSNELLSFGAVVEMLGITGQSSLGVREIPVNSIVGSVGRYSDFTNTFLPRSDVDEERWISVRSASVHVGDLPPIDVYQLGDSYFVSDGNHRVSIARQEGLDYIDANVTEVRTRVPLPADASLDELLVAAEYAEFLEQTRFDRVRPGARLWVSVPGQYRHLENHIEAFRYLTEQELGVVLSDEEALSQWYDNAYMPLVEALREQDFLRYFPGRTETDFYVWLARHQKELEHRMGVSIAPSVAVARLMGDVDVPERARRTALGRWRDRVAQLIIPERPQVPPQSWSRERLLDRYTSHLFASILVPIDFKHDDSQRRLPHLLRRAVMLAAKEDARLWLHSISPGESGEDVRVESVQALRAQLADLDPGLDLPINVTSGDGDPVAQLDELAHLNDLIVIDRLLGHSAGSGNGSNGQFDIAIELMTASRRPVHIIAAETSPAAIERAVLVLDGRVESRECLFVAAYLAERWGVDMAVCAFPVGRRGAGALSFARDYLQMHEVAPYRVEALALNDLLPRILSVAEATGSDMIILPGPAGTHTGDRLHLIQGLLSDWPRALLVAN